MQLTIALPRLRLGRALAADGPAVGQADAPGSGFWATGCSMRVDRKVHPYN